MSIGIDELFDMLSWKSDDETQKRGIELAKQIECYSVFLQPHGLKHDKDVWGNCAKILSEYPDEILRFCSLGMLVWLEDINWPGAETILERLIKFNDTSLLSIFIVRCVKQALACNQQDWLGNMSALLENENLKNNLPPDIYELLKCHYNK